MKWNKKWLSMVMITAMLLTLVPAVHAEEAPPPIQAEEQIPVDPSGEIDPATPPEQQAPAAETEGVAAAVYGEHRNLAQGLPYEWSEGPEPTHPDDGTKLTDGKKGTKSSSDPAWVGHHKKKTREVVFDLGEEKSISSINAHFLQDWPTNNVLMPLTVSMYVSDDKQNWGLLSHNATQTLWKDGQYEETYAWDGSKDGIPSVGSDAKIAYARYVKVTFSMHTRAMTFIDEIEILGTDGKAEGAVSVPTQQPAFLAPGDATAGIKHLGLLYNGQYANDLGTWTKDRIIPNISYVDKTGKPVDWLFDGVLYLGLNPPTPGRDFGGNAYLEDWEWYLTKTFAPTGDMYQLNEATKEVGAALGQPDQKEKVVLMIPDPGESIKNFGTINGENLSFSASDVGKEKALANREKAVQWYLNEVKQKWEAANYSHLELVGMYWLEEQISTSSEGPDLIRSVSDKVHTMNVSGNGSMKFFWIPHSLAYKSYMWKDVGFDAAAFQPNYFFEPMDYDRLEDAANIAKRYGMTNEFEFDDRMLTDGVFRERYIDYLNSGVETGLMTDGFNAYYQGNNAVYNSAVSTDPANRILYDWLYQYVKGTYTVKDAAPPEVEVQMNGQPYHDGIVLPDTESVQFTWKLKEDDGITKVTATYDGKAYTAGTVMPLAGKLGKHELVITVTSGKSQKTSYVVEASTNAMGVKAAVDSFVKSGQITDAGAASALNDVLDTMKQFEGVDQVQYNKHLKSFSAKLDQFKTSNVMKDEAYNTLKESVYYLIGSLAQGKAVEALSTEGGNPNYVPAKAVDGIPASRWASDYVDNTWFLVDLGEVKEMDTVRISWEYARADKYKLLVSNDKQNWTNVMPNDGIITAHDGKETVQFDPVKARYMKFQGVKRATDYGYSFYEFGVYNLSEKAAVNESNLALGLSYTWSEAPEAAYPDDNNELTDGKYGKLDISDPAWVGHHKKKTREVVFDLGDKKSISKVKAHFLQDWPTNNVLLPLTVSMYVSDDKQDWGLLSDNATQVLWIDGLHDETYTWDGSKDGIKSIGPDAKIAYARYVKVTFTMHTRAMSFVDEIEILGTDGKGDGAVTVPTQQPKFLPAGEATAGIEHLGLLYNGQYKNNLGTWTKDRIIPNISYVDQTGKPVDRLFDGVLYLGLNPPTPGRDFGGNAYLEDWKWYLDKTFAKDGDMDELDKASEEVSKALNQPGVKEKVVLMIPDPGESIKNFGTIDGENLSFSAADVGKEKALANREKAIQWYLNEVKQKWEAANYSHLELVGMYWLEEQISTSSTGPDLLRSVSEKVHTMNVAGNNSMKFFWIPHFYAYKSFMWKDVGFDAVALQPNYFFEPNDYERFEDAANLAKQYGMSNELEFDDRMLTDGVFRERYIHYLNSGVETGLMKDGFKAYYQGNNAVYDSAVSKDPATRVLYDWLYQFVKGEYKINNALPSDLEVQMNGQPFQSGATLPATESVSFTWKLKEDDGQTKVTATYDGKPYTAGTIIPLAGKLGKHELVITATAGKLKKTSYVIEATTNASGMKMLVDRFDKAQQFTNAGVVRSLNNVLEKMQSYEGKDKEQFTKHLKVFNAKLDEFKKESTIKDEAYNTLKECVYYLAGNLAQNKAVEASSTEGNNPDYAPAKAVDGFPSTRWASDYVDNTWFLVDLGEVKEMDTVRIDWEYARADKYKILVSNDKQTWTNVMPNDGTVTAHEGKDTVQFKPVKARYMKFQGITRATDYGYSFYEFGIYNLSVAVDEGNPGNGNGPDGNNNGNGNGNSSGNSTPAPATVEIKPQADGSVKATVGSKLDSDGKTVVGAISEQDLRKAIAGAKANQNGKLKVTVEVKENGKAANYALDLPASFFSENPNLIIEVSTPKASIVLSGQMFAKSSELGKQLRFIVGEGDRKSLSQTAQAQVGNRPFIVLEAKMDGKSIAWKNEKAPVIITIPYLRTTQELASRIGILSINGQGAGTMIAGAAYSDADKAIRFQADRTGAYAVFYEQSASQFTDLGSHSWAKEAIEKLAELGIVKGTSGTTFSPAEQVSRTDFILMLVRALDLKGEAGAAFTDVQAQDYYYEAVSIAKQLGIVTGMDGDRFVPKAKMTRQDMMVMAARALKAAKAQEITGDLASLEGFKDAGKVSDYAASSIAGMIGQGLIQGDGGMIHPHSNTTRAETAVFLHRLLNYMSK